MLKRSLPALLAVAALALSACGGSDSSGGSATDSASASTSTADRGTPSGSAAPADVSCTYKDSGDASVKADLPPSKPTVGGDVAVTMNTSIGALHLTLDATKTPCTVNAIVSLVQQGWYDGGFCPRLTTTADSGLEILQCGDSSDSQAASPGWTYADELTGQETYPTGTVAMANAGPDTNGGQFFICYGDAQLTPDYTVIGTVDQAGVKAIADLAAKGGSSSSDWQSVKIDSAVFG